MSAAAREAPRLMAVVVFPTPPFWFAMAMILPMVRAPEEGESLAADCAEDADGPPVPDDAFLNPVHRAAAHPRPPRNPRLNSLLLHTCSTWNSFTQRAVRTGPVETIKRDCL